ncbi:uncharacterized protein [Primulina huaijiensis]|uniref:uncharacterized protein n=1 Tax=Primulina huaijiensis TaxID=1492673 RepID=UPI003CC77CC0
MIRGCCSEMVLQKKGPWTVEEDELLMNYIRGHGEGPWKSLPHRAGLHRCGKSCRIRWMNYLRPNIRRGNITPDEDDIIIRMHMLLGNRWSLIAGRLPGRTDNEIKNYWNTRLSKKKRSSKAISLLGIPRLPFRHGKNNLDLNASNYKGNINNKNVVGADHVYDNEPKYKKYENVENTERVKFFTPKPINGINTTSSSRVEVLAPKPIRVTASYSSKADTHASNITSALGNANNNSCNGRGENCKLIEEVHNFFDNEDIEDKNHVYEICTDCLGIYDGWLKVPHQGNTENLVDNEHRTLEMVYEEYF